MKIFNYLIPALLFFSCTSKNKNDSNGTGSTTSVTQVITRTDTLYVVRNIDITPANAYSDLFLDSSAVDQYISSNNLTEEEQKSVKSFYNYRNLQFAWFTTQGFTEQAKGFWNLQDKLGSEANKSLRSRMDTLLNMDTLSLSRFDSSIFKTELALTQAYLQFYKSNRDKTQFLNLSPEMAIPVKKQKTSVLADTIVLQRTDSSSGSATQYNLLKQKLQQYNALLKNHGWTIINFSARQIKKGTSSPAISIIKKRLQLTGDMITGDTTAVFNDSLVAVIKSYQLRNGMKPSGNITDTLIRSLNVPVEKRIQQIIINLSRAQWMPATTESNYISVNIPDYLLTVYENNAKAFDIPVAVGKEGTNTTMFTGELNQVVFSPYWNIPASIVQRDILPKMKGNPNYLKSRNMEQVGKNDSLPVIRQLPGKGNSLGKVKFLFPNRYDIYFHDTNAKDVFNKDKRAVSHGCIRLAEAEKLATYLLRNNNWTLEKVQGAMNAGKEQYVKVNPVMPVVITYYTAWVDETGQLHFRDDIYNNDDKLRQMMFETE
ncbi:MAG: L,D-transpeptidase family protein [Ferruginibacter sp.]